jgi:hypothetical protein
MMMAETHHFGLGGGAPTPPPQAFHDAFRWGKGLGKIKGRLYTLLRERGPLTARELASLTGYGDDRLKRIYDHLHALVEKDVLIHRNDGRYEILSEDLDGLADVRGTRGASQKQLDKAREQREGWRAARQGFSAVFRLWLETGELVDPRTGMSVGKQPIPEPQASEGDFYTALSKARFLAARKCRRIISRPNGKLVLTLDQ